MPWVLIALMVIGAGISIYVIKMVLSEDSPHRKSPAVTVTLVKPPLPQIKEKPPEPVKEIEKKEEVFTPSQEVASQESKPAGEQDSAPQGDQLGVDAEGIAGSDAFGLVGKKGGRSILAGEGGSGGGGLGRLSLLSKVSGYTQIVENEVRRSVMKYLDENGGIPKGKLQTIVRIIVDSKGAIVKYSIIGSSGNHRMDEAVERSLRDIRISAPPENKSTTMSIKITSQG